MTTPHSTSAQTFALAALLAFTAACGVDSDIGSPCRHASTISMPFPAEAILEDSKECSTGTCLAYEGPSYLLYSNTLEECLAEDDGSRCSLYPPAQHFERYVYCSCRCPDECECEGDGLECRTVVTGVGGVGREEDLCVRTD
jgi:hypothetical protein